MPLERGKFGEGVASFTDAWIETFLWQYLIQHIQSHLLQMRGLKHVLLVCFLALQTSHLLQMRGLKLVSLALLEPVDAVASFTDAWIETCMPY